MKLIALLVMTAALIGCGPCKGEENNWVVSGPALTGKITHVHPEEYSYARMNLVQVEAAGHKIQVSNKHYNLKSFVGPTATSWIADRASIVRLGRDALAREITFMPNYAYGLDYTITVYGRMEATQPGVYTFGPGITFLYDDPKVNEPVCEFLTGALIQRPSMPEHPKVYDTTLTFKNSNVQDPGDAIFQSTLKGTIIVEDTVIKVDNKTWKGMVMSINLDSDNCTKAQIVNFAQWWCSCIVPAMY